MKWQEKNWRWIASGLLWLGLVSIGLGILWWYDNAPGAAAAPASSWPTESQIQRVPGRAALVMLAHPQCPCTRASLGELALLMTQCEGRVTASVLFYQPEGFSAAWTQTDLWQSAAAIPGVTVKRDEGGIEAGRFHAATSGQVLLYDAAGRLIFSGGITGGRGQAGDHAGRSAMVSLITGGAAKHARTFVFGCSLLDSHSADRGVQSCKQ